ncbi:uncharacterized protein [Procambarus clarkii]|uniref:uncharacterized protein isoform X1 n=1 Tax=Procambarus clarkii TaxID=6728 RepID=UPI003742D7D3
MNDPLHDPLGVEPLGEEPCGEEPLGEEPLGEDPLGEHLDFEIKEEPFEFFEENMMDGDAGCDNGGGGDDDSDATANVCMICGNSLHFGRVVTVTRGLQRIREASLQKQDDIVAKLEKVSSVRLHTKCRKDYTRPMPLKWTLARNIKINQSQQPDTLQVCWVSEGVTIIENGGEAYEEKEEMESTPDVDCLSSSSEHTVDSQYNTPGIYKSSIEVEEKCSINGTIFPDEKSILHNMKKMKKCSVVLGDLNIENFKNDIKKVSLKKPSIKKTVTDKLSIKKTANEKLGIKKMGTEKINTKKAAIDKPSIKKLPIEKLYIKKIPVERPNVKKGPIEKITIKKAAIEKPSIKKAAIEKPNIKKAAIEKLFMKNISIEKPTIKNVPTEKPTIKKVPTEKPSIKKVPTEKPSIKKVPTEKPSIKKLPTENPSIKKLPIEKPIIKKKEEKCNCLIKKEIKYPPNEETECPVTIENEGKYKRELECQLAKYRSNIKRMQKILDEERAKMLKVQSTLVNMRRRLRRRELKMIKIMKNENDVKEEKEDNEEWNGPTMEREMEVKGPIILEETANKKRKGIEQFTKMKMQKCGHMKSNEGGEEILIMESEIKKPIKKGVGQVKKREKGEQVKAMKAMMRVDAPNKREDFEEITIEEVQKNTRVQRVEVEIEEKNVKPEIQIATSHMLWNVLSHIKTEPYLTHTIESTKDMLQLPHTQFTLHPHNKSIPPDIPLLVKEFMLREDVSKACSPLPDTAEEIPDARYRIHYLLILYKQFVAEHGLLCDYKTFGVYVPKNVIKPSAGFWKTCTCFPCINPELKFEKLNSLGFLKMSGIELGDILYDTEMENTLMAQLRILRESRDVFSYDAWERTCSGTIHSKRRSVSEPVGIVVAKFFEELSFLKSHIQKIFCQLDAAKLARERAMHSADEVTIHLDCSPIPIYRYVGSESPSSDIATILTILTGYLWSEEGYQSVIAISDSKDYTTAAVWAGLEKILLNLVQAGKTKINIISDCPTNRYRNKSNFYYMSDFAQVYGVCFRWVFLELGHGIGHAGIVRSEFDNVIRDQMSNNSSLPVRNSCDVLSLVQAHTSSSVHTYTEEDVKKYKFLLPKLRVIQGTQKFQEVIILPEDFWVRDVVSHDAFRKLCI